MYGEAAMVLPAHSIPGSRNMRIGSCVKSLLKNCIVLQQYDAVIVFADVLEHGGAESNVAPALRETLWFMPLFRTEFTQYAYR